METKDEPQRHSVRVRTRTEKIKGSIKKPESEQPTETQDDDTKTDSESPDTNDKTKDETETKTKRNANQNGEGSRRSRQKEVVKVRQNPQLPPTKIAKAKGKPVIRTRVKTNVEKKDEHVDGDTMWQRIRKASGWPI